MAFIRHIDPVESMKIGRRDDSIEVIGAQFSIDRSLVRLQTPELIFNFLKKIEKIEFPDDLYRPHNIILITKVEIEDHMDDLIRAMAKAKAVCPGINPQAILTNFQKIRTEIREIRLRYFYGKTIIFSKQFILIPLEKDLQEKATWLIEDEQIEAERIINEKINEERRVKYMKKMMENEIFSESKRREIEIEGRKAMAKMIANSTFKIKTNFNGLVHDHII